ncbi:MAG: aldehyde ferredoxin oxidoreductase N-terminal domain-containing protein [Anaerolineae bacterium]|nr:aldehyde ferredoxin oxidoreductase N-terminal domain-containing protein [Anaerolineae bacterium]
MNTFSGGYTGVMLRVDLDTQVVQKVPSPEPDKWLGSRGWNALIGWNEVPPGTGPFDPENRIIFSTGALVGTGAPTAGRTTLSTIGPRGYPVPMWTSSSMGGYWGAELKYAGYDSIVVHGKAVGPCYILIEDDRVSIEDAGELWGLGVHTTQQQLKIKHSPQHQILVIGPAGENMVRYASIIHRLSNASGNGGFGGVMGSKNLKAIVVRGTGSVRIADPDQYLNVIAQTWELTKGGLRHIGQPERGYPNVACSHGCSVNCYARIIKPPAQLDANTPMRMMKCVNGSMVRGGHHGYQGSSSSGDNLNVPGPVALHEAGLDIGNLIDELGLTVWCYDTWSRYLGGLKEIGVDEILGEKIELDNALWWRDLLVKIAFREGIGDEFAEDFPRFYAKHHIGPEHLAEFVNSKGSRGHGWHRDGRAMERHPSPFWEYSALLYAVSTRDVTPSTHGFFFLNGLYGYPDAPKQVAEIPLSLQELAEKVYGSREAVFPGDGYIEYVTRWHQHRAIIKDSLGLCDFIFPVTRRNQDTYQDMMQAINGNGDDICGDIDIEAKLYKACTGLDIDTAEMDSPIAERIVNLERCLDVRNFGRNREIDEAVIPHFQWAEKTDGTQLSADANEFRALLDRFYDLRGWDKQTGAPTPEKLDSLGLETVNLT